MSPRRKHLVKPQNYLKESRNITEQKEAELVLLKGGRSDWHIE